MDKNKFWIICAKTISIINSIFWGIVLLYYSLKFPENILMKILLFTEIIIFLIIFFALIYKNKFILISATIFLFINSILSITDEIGTLDLISLALSLILFGNVIILLIKWNKKPL